jgi:hypothetical protein
MGQGYNDAESPAIGIVPFGLIVLAIESFAYLHASHRRPRDCRNSRVTAPPETR